MGPSWISIDILRSSTRSHVHLAGDGRWCIIERRRSSELLAFSKVKLGAIAEVLTGHYSMSKVRLMSC